MYQRALTLIAALLATHFAWSAIGDEELSAPGAVLAKIATIASARLVGLRSAPRRYVREADARGTPEHSMPSPRVGLVASFVSPRRSGDVTMDAYRSP